MASVQEIITVVQALKSYTGKYMVRMGHRKPRPGTRLTIVTHTPNHVGFGLSRFKAEEGRRATGRQRLVQRDE